MILKHFFDQDTPTFTYVIHDKGSTEAVVIDPVWNFDQASGKVTETSITAVRDYLTQNNLALTLILETHAHADHLSGAARLKSYFPAAKVKVSERINQVVRLFAELFHLTDVPLEGQQFDGLLKDYEIIEAAGLRIKVLPTPGHTPACTSFLVGDAVFTGDALFMPDLGTGRCDFPGGSAARLFQSIKTEIYSLDDQVKVMTGHDYPPKGREVRYSATVGEQKAHNIHIRSQTTEQEYVTMRETRDRTLSMPRLLLPSLQVNIRAGQLPPVESNGVSYLKLPVREISPTTLS